MTKRLDTNNTYLRPLHIRVGQQPKAVQRIVDADFLECFFVKTYLLEKG